MIGSIPITLIINKKHNKLWIIPIVLCGLIVAVIVVTFARRKYKKNYEYSQLSINYEIRDIKTNLKGRKTGFSA
jgi:cytochrome c-type biogenesis protein CcmH/NrfF